MKGLILNAVSAAVLIHHSYITTDFESEGVKSPAVTEAYKTLMHYGLLDSMHEITPKGLVLVDFWLRTPLPEATWSIPDRY